MRATLFCVLTTVLMPLLASAHEPVEEHLLYVAEPGIRNYTQFGGHGLLVFDIDNGHKFVKRIPLAGLREDGTPDNVKGIAASATTGRLYVSTRAKLQCIDIVTEQSLWERTYKGGCDRMSLSPDGKVLYLPSFEKDHWNVVDARSGDIVTEIRPKSRAHNTVFGADGKRAYLAGLASPLLTIADAKKHKTLGTAGPFGGSIRPFTINRKQTLAFATVNRLLGFEIADLRTGKLLHRVEVPGVSSGPVKRHGCPSHGIGLTPDEKQIWVSDGHNSLMHVFDATSMPPTFTTSIALRDQPGWVTFSIDGAYAYPSTGEVVSTKTHKIVARLSDEKSRMVQSEKMLEVDFLDGLPVRCGDQFGVGRAGAKPQNVFAKWASNMKRFAAQDKKSPPPMNEIVFVGSSSIVHWDIPASFPEIKIVKRGFGGSEIADSIRYLDEVVLRYKPRVVVLYAGDNDIGKGKSATRVVADFNTFVKKIHAKLPKTRVVFLPIKPSIARWKLVEEMKEANAAIREICEKSQKLDYADTFSPMLGDDGKPRPELFVKDGLHMSEAGYALWNRIVRPFLK